MRLTHSIHIIKFDGQTDHWYAERELGRLTDAHSVERLTHAIQRMIIDGQTDHWYTDKENYSPLQPIFKLLQTRKLSFQQE